MPGRRSRHQAHQQLPGEAAPGVTATSRNWNTVRKLAELTSGLARPGSLAGGGRGSVSLPAGRWSGPACSFSLVVSVARRIRLTWATPLLVREPPFSRRAARPGRAARPRWRRRGLGQQRRHPVRGRLPVAGSCAAVLGRSHRDHAVRISRAPAPAVPAPSARGEQRIRAWRGHRKARPGLSVVFTDCPPGPGERAELPGELVRRDHHAADADREYVAGHSAPSHPGSASGEPPAGPLPSAMHPAYHEARAVSPDPSPWHSKCPGLPCRTGRHGHLRGTNPGELMAGAGPARKAWPAEPRRLWPR